MRQYPTDMKSHKRDTSELDPCLAAQSRIQENFCTKWRRLILVTAVILFVLIAFIAAVLFFLFRPAKTEEGLDYIHYEVPSPFSEFDNIGEELIGVRSGPMYTAHPKAYLKPRSRPPLQNQREHPWHSSKVVANLESPSASSVSTHAEASTAPTTGKLFDNYATIKLVYEKRPPFLTILPTTSPSTTMTESLQTRLTSSATETYTATQTPPIAKTSYILETSAPHTSTTRRATPSASEEAAKKRPVILMSGDVQNDCSVHLNSGKGSGVYLIAPDGGKPFPVYCDQETAGGGWTVIQRRVSGDVRFHNRTWVQYAKGFGYLDGSHWLGLENVHRLAPISKDSWILRVELHGDHCAGRGCFGVSDGYWWAEWPFKLGDASQRYLLELGKVIRGNLTDEKSDFFQRNNFHPFTTVDNDNDDDNLNCAQFRHFGGWWHEKCGSVALNGMYGDTTPIHRHMMYLVRQNLEKGYRRRVVHPKKSVMMIKPNSST